MEIMALNDFNRKGTEETDLVSANEAKTKCPQVVIRFYQDRLILQKAVKATH